MGTFYLWPWVFQWKRQSWVTLPSDLPGNRLLTPVFFFLLILFLLQAITRLILSGTFDRHPDLRILLAHSGGALPQLSSRLASCIFHDPVVSSKLQHDARYYVSKLYFDAVNYGPEEMGFVADVIGRGPAFNGGQRGDRQSGYKRLLFGTDHPFFPPLTGEAKWRSVLENLQAINNVNGWSDTEKSAVRGANALDLFGILRD